MRAISTNNNPAGSAPAVLIAKFFQFLSVGSAWAVSYRIEARATDQLPPGGRLAALNGAVWCERRFLSFGQALGWGE